MKRRLKKYIKGACVLSVEEVRALQKEPPEFQVAAAKSLMDVNLLLTELSEEPLARGTSLADIRVLFEGVIARYALSAPCEKELLDIFSLLRDVLQREGNNNNE